MWTKIFLWYSRLYSRKLYVFRGATRIKKVLRDRAIDQVINTEKNDYFVGSAFDEKVKMSRKLDFWFVEEKKVINKFIEDINKGNRVIDVGANVGGYSIIAGLKGADVFAFEMDPANVQRLERNKELNSLDFEIVDKAVYDSNTTIKAKMEGSGGSNLREGSTEVQTVVLDDYIDTKVDLVKIDVEGAEMNVLKGMRRILEKYEPILYVEVHDEALKELNYSSKDLEQYLRDLGYSIQIIESRAGVYNIRCEKLT